MYVVPSLEERLVEVIGVYGLLTKKNSVDVGFFTEHYLGRARVASQIFLLKVIVLDGTRYCGAARWWGKLRLLSFLRHVYQSWLTI